jgi:hypothetical protein
MHFPAIIKQVVLELTDGHTHDRRLCRIDVLVYGVDRVGVGAIIEWTMCRN